MVPPEWERGWGLQFTRHICRCCISNWESQAVRKNTYTNTGTHTEEYTGCLFLSHMHRLQVQHRSVLSSTARKRRRIWASEQGEIENLLASASPSIKILTLMWGDAKRMTRRSWAGILSADVSNREEECAHQWSSCNASQSTFHTTGLTEP